MSELPGASDGVSAARRELAWRRLLFAHAPDALFALDGEGRLLEANEAFARLLGCTLDTALALRLWEWDVDFPEPRAREVLQRDAPEEVTFESRWRRADGQLRLVETRIHRLRDGAARLIVGSSRDITDRRDAEMALRASEARLALALRASAMGVWDWLVDRGEVHFSRAACALLDIDPPGPDGGDIPLAMLADRLPADDMARLTDASQRALLTKGEFTVTVLMRDRRGVQRWIEDQGRVVSDGDNQPLRMVGTVRDITAQREAQALLAREAARRRALFEQSRDGILVLDDCGLVLEANPAMAGMLGRPLATLQGQGVRALGVALPGVDLMAALAAAPSGRISFGAVVGPAGGTQLHLEVSASAVLAEGQKLVFAVCRDVTQRQQAEAALRESEALHRATFENSAVGMAEFALDGRWLNANPRLCEITGYSRDALMALDFRQLTHPDDRRDEWPRLRQLLRGELTSTRREKRYLRQDGSTIWVAVSSALVRDEQQRGRYFVTVVEDITDRVRVQDELARHRQHLEAEVAERTQALQQAMRARSDGEHFLRSIADNIPDMVGYWDAGRVLRFANRPYRDWFAAGSDPVGRTRADFFGDPDTDAGEQAFAAALGGQAQRFEYVLTNPLGEVRYAWVHYIPDRQGSQVVGLFVLVSDLSEVKQAELRLQALNEQLVAARDRAEAANRAKSAFLANISHEIRTPMNAIIGLTHLMQRDAGSGPVAERLGKVSDAAHHLLDVINDVLDLSKIESGKLHLEQTDFPIDAVLSRACALVAERARAKGLELVLKSEGVPPLLRGDPTRVSQALLNLMSNAVKFTDRGSIVLRCELMGADADALRLRFSVRDTGVGVPADKISSLFNAFEQADTSTTRRFGGTGLGLAITRRLAILMGGDVGVHTVQGQGSCFWFTANFERASQPGHTDSTRLPGRRVLVADDLPEARAALADLLRRMGMQVDSVASGDEAVQAALEASRQRRPYALLLFDAGMPGTDGPAALRQLREHLGEAGLPPSILIVDDGQALASAPAPEPGVLERVLKPVTLSTLSACIDRLDRQPWQRPLPDRTEPQPHERALQLRAAGLRVLLAEDNPINQEVATALLQAVGVAVDLAADGQQAVQLAAQRHYDLVLMDMQMPVMDGLAATRALRAMPQHARTPILAMTANAFGDDRRACLDAGMDDHIAKPVDPELLYAMLGRWLPARLVDGDAPAAPAPVAVPQPQPDPAAVATDAATGAPVAVAADAKAMVPPMAPALPAAAPAAVASVPKPPAPDFSGIDGLTMSRALLYLPGRDEVYARVLRQFSANYGQGVPGLDVALQAGDLAAAQRVLHSLRGACGAVGATAVQAEAQALELQLKAPEAADATAAADAADAADAAERPLPSTAALHTQLARLVAAVRQRLAAAESPPAPAGAGMGDAGALAGRLQALAGQLAQGDFQAGQAFRQLEPALRAALGAAATARLGQPLQQHDHAAALQQCRALLGQLQAPGQ